LPDYVASTLWLCLGVGCGVIVVGVATAWLTAMHDFPGRRVFEWALVLPLAMPAYVLAYVYTDFLQFVGPLQTWLREYLRLESRPTTGFRTCAAGGAVAMFVFVLYPYVYLLARTAFIERASGMLEGCAHARPRPVAQLSCASRCRWRVRRLSLLARRWH
jgi:iron(III) transport system permease protein